MEFGFFQQIVKLSEILLIPSQIDFQRQQEQIATGLKVPILSSSQSASSNYFSAHVTNRRTVSLAIAQVSTQIQDQAFQIIKYQHNLLLMHKTSSQARENVLRTGFKLDRLLQLARPFKQLNKAQSWTSVYWERALKLEFCPSIFDQNSKSVPKNVQTLQEEKIALDSNLNQDSKALEILRNDGGLQQIMPNSSPRITQSKQPIQIEQSSIGSKHISNDDLSSARVIKKKISLSQVDSLMKDVHDPKNGAVSVPHKQFETDSNNYQEEAFDNNEHEATNNHVKVIKQTLLPKQQSPSKSKRNTTYKFRQLAKTKKTTNHGSTSLDTLGHWSQ